MTDTRSKLMCAFAALALASSANVFAAQGDPVGTSASDADQKQQTTPKDCKKNPTDPRCKETK